MDLSPTSQQLVQSYQDAQQQASPAGRLGMFVSDPVHVRLLEGIALHLELGVEQLNPEQFRNDSMTGFELVVADQDAAEQLYQRLARNAVDSDQVHAAVVSLTPGGISRDQASLHTDGIISLPQEPSLLVAQLSVVLYAHRAFARRYQSAMEELQLNRRIFRSVTSGISVADATHPNMPLTYVNPAFEIMTGYCLEDVQGQNCRFLQGEDREQPALHALREAIRTRRQVTVVLRNYRKDGSCFWNELSLAPIRNRKGDLTHFVGIQTDVTARVEFEAALRESEKLAAVGRLAASIAHEINNPLESVMNLLYIAQGEQSLDSVKHFLSEAESEVKRIALITTQSLRFYRQNTHAQLTDCDQLLREVVDLYAPKLMRFHIKVDHVGSTHKPVFCMDSEIRQVLSNLVRNAIDAMRPNGGRMLVRTREMTEWRSGKRGIAITVADNGSGIAPDVIKKLYTAFFTTKGDTGTGLGLWVSANIVERHSGRMLLRSSNTPQRHGTVFTVFLPFDGMKNTSPN